MAPEAIQSSPRPGSCAADLARVFDAAGRPCKSYRKRASSSTSTSTSTSTLTGASQRSALRPRPDHRPSSPILMQAYANRPLPRLPSSALASSAPAGMAELQIRRRTPKRLADCRGRQPEFQNSHEPLAPSSRRSSRKIHQLTGVRVHVADSSARLASPTRASADSFSIDTDPEMGDHGVPDRHLVPFLEAEDDTTSSRGSSWAPMSPESDAIPAPLNIRKPIADGHERRMDGLGEPSPHMDLDEDAPIAWDSPHGLFSDMGAAGEYHRFTADLALRHSRQAGGDGVVPSATWSKKKRTSLRLPFGAATLFSRRREPSDASTAPRSSCARPGRARKDLPSSPRQSPADFIAGPACSSAWTSAAVRCPADVAPPRPPPAPPLMSAWDSDSDGDEVPAMTSLKDWFAHRAAEERNGRRRMSSTSRASSDQHVAVLGSGPGDGREPVTCRQEREAQIMREKAAKRWQARQADVKKSFAMAPGKLDSLIPRFI